MNNAEIAAKEGADFKKINDYYSARQIQVAIANRLGKIRRNNNE